MNSQGISFVSLTVRSQANYLTSLSINALIHNIEKVTVLISLGRSNIIYVKCLAYTKCQINKHIFCLFAYPLEIIVTPLVSGNLTKTNFQSAQHLIQRNIQRISVGVFIANHPPPVLNWDEVVPGLSPGSSLDRQLWLG